jgi:molybdopterin-guanine dinucleotide biosynthesis protein A
MITLSALLLAGGESRRMGRDKATIEFNGQPLWERQLAILRALEPESIFVSARIAPSWLPNDVKLLLDDPPSRGPLSGLVKALTTMRTSHLVALAIDMPFMTNEALRRLLGETQRGEGLVPVIRDRAEPLAAIYPAEAGIDFVAAFTGTDFSLQLIIRKLAADEKLRLVPVTAEDEHLYRSVNEPSDFKERRFPNRRPE